MTLTDQTGRASQSGSTEEIGRTEVADAVEDGITNLVSSLDLYSRWERQQWRVAQVKVERDVEAWRTMRPFARQELLGALVELEVGEVCVTETLSSLVDHAPTSDDRIYLCTQLADEARHVRFFQSYLQTTRLTEAVAEQSTIAPTYATYFEPELRRATAAVRETGGDRAAWYAALVLYHLVTEGILAMTVMRTTRQIARRVPLAALDEGLTNVMRDESRHVGFGLMAAREGVRGGYRDPIWPAYRDGSALAARVLVGPDRRAVSPAIRPALLQRAAQLAGQWAVGRERMLRQLGLIGLGELHVEASQAWEDGCAAALDEYQQRWGVEHPVRRAAALASAGS